MNDKKQKQLLAAARACAPLEPPTNFSAGVLAGVARQDSLPAEPPLFDQLSALFPRVVVTAAAIVVVAIAFEFYGGDDLTVHFAQISEEWLLPLEWL
jgi:hypothetical protein